VIKKHLSNISLKLKDH